MWPIGRPSWPLPIEAKAEALLLAGSVKDGVHRQFAQLIDLSGEVGSEISRGVDENDSGDGYEEKKDGDGVSAQVNQWLEWGLVFPPSFFDDSIQCGTDDTCHVRDSKTWTKEHLQGLQSGLLNTLTRQIREREFEEVKCENPYEGQGEVTFDDPAEAQLYANIAAMEEESSAQSGSAHELSTAINASDESIAVGGGILDRAASELFQSYIAGLRRQRAPVSNLSPATNETLQPSVRIIVKLLMSSIVNTSWTDVELRLLSDMLDELEPLSLASATEPKECIDIMERCILGYGIAASHSVVDPVALPALFSLCVCTGSLSLLLKFIESLSAQVCSLSDDCKARLFTSCQRLLDYDFDRDQRTPSAEDLIGQFHLGWSQDTRIVAPVEIQPWSARVPSCAVSRDRLFLVRCGNLMSYSTGLDGEVSGTCVAKMSLVKDMDYWIAVVSTSDDSQVLWVKEKGTDCRLISVRNVCTLGETLSFELPEDISISTRTVLVGSGKIALIVTPQPSTSGCDAWIGSYNQTNALSEGYCTWTYLCIPGLSEASLLDSRLYTDGCKLWVIYGRKDEFDAEIELRSFDLSTGDEDPERIIPCSILLGSVVCYDSMNSVLWNYCEFNGVVRILRNSHPGPEARAISQDREQLADITVLSSLLLDFARERADQFWPGYYLSPNRERNIPYCAEQSPSACKSLFSILQSCNGQYQKRDLRSCLKLLQFNCYVIGTDASSSPIFNASTDQDLIRACRNILLENVKSQQHSDLSCDILLFAFKSLFTDENDQMAFFAEVCSNDALGGILSRLSFWLARSAISWSHFLPVRLPHFQGLLKYLEDVKNIVVREKLFFYLVQDLYIAAIVEDPPHSAVRQFANLFQAIMRGTSADEILINRALFAAKCVESSGSIPRVAQELLPILTEFIQKHTTSDSNMSLSTSHSCVTQKYVLETSHPMKESGTREFRCESSTWVLLKFEPSTCLPDDCLINLHVEGTTSEERVFSFSGSTLPTTTLLFASNSVKITWESAQISNDTSDAPYGFVCTIVTSNAQRAVTMTTEANMGALQRSVTSLLCKVATSLIKGPSLSAMEKENAHVLKGELFQQGLEEDDSYLSDAEKSLLHDFIEGVDDTSSKGYLFARWMRRNIGRDFSEILPLQQAENAVMCALLKHHDLLYMAAEYVNSQYFSELLGGGLKSSSKMPPPPLIDLWKRLRRVRDAVMQKYRQERQNIALERRAHDESPERLMQKAYRKVTDPIVGRAKFLLSVSSGGSVDLLKSQTVRQSIGDAVIQFCVHSPLDEASVKTLLATKTIRVSGRTQGLSAMTALFNSISQDSVLALITDQVATALHQCSDDISGHYLDGTPSSSLGSIPQITAAYWEFVKAVLSRCRKHPQEWDIARSLISVLSLLFKKCDHEFLIKLDVFGWVRGILEGPEAGFRMRELKRTANALLRLLSANQILNYDPTDISTDSDQVLLYVKESMSSIIRNWQGPSFSSSFFYYLASISVTARKLLAATNIHDIMLASAPSDKPRQCLQMFRLIRLVAPYQENPTDLVKQLGEFALRMRDPIGNDNLKTIMNRITCRYFTKSERLPYLPVTDRMLHMPVALSPANAESAQAIVPEADASLLIVSDTTVSIQSVVPIPVDAPLFYAELTIMDPGSTGSISMGLYPTAMTISGLPGWDNKSFGVHASDGCRYSMCTNSVGAPYMPSFASSGQVVGLFFNIVTGVVFYTLNGTRQSDCFKNVSGSYFFAIGVQSKDARVRVNFGQSPFMYSLLRVTSELAVHGSKLGQSSTHIRGEVQDLLRDCMKYQKWRYCINAWLLEALQPLEQIVSGQDTSNHSFRKAEVALSVINDRFYGIREGLVVTVSSEKEASHPSAVVVEVIPDDHRAKVVLYDQEAGAALSLEKDNIIAELSPRRLPQLPCKEVVDILISSLRILAASSRRPSKTVAGTCALLMRCFEALFLDSEMVRRGLADGLLQLLVQQALQPVPQQTQQLRESVQQNHILLEQRILDTEVTPTFKPSTEGMKPGTFWNVACADTESFNHWHSGTDWLIGKTGRVLQTAADDTVLLEFSARGKRRACHWVCKSSLTPATEEKKQSFVLASFCHLSRNEARSAMEQAELHLAVVHARQAIDSFLSRLPQNTAFPISALGGSGNLIQLLKLLVLTHSKHPKFGQAWTAAEDGLHDDVSQPQSCPDYCNLEKSPVLAGLLRRLASYLKQEAVLKLMPESSQQAAKNAFNKWKEKAEKRRAASPSSDRRKDADTSSTSRQSEEVKRKHASMTGYLKKHSGGLLGRWQKRWFVLGNEILFIYSSQNSKSPHEYVPLKAIIEVKEVNKKKQNLLVLVSARKEWGFLAPTPEERSLWSDAIRSKIEEMRNPMARPIDDGSIPVPVDLPPIDSKSQESFSFIGMLTYEIIRSLLTDEVEDLHPVTYESHHPYIPSEDFGVLSTSVVVPNAESFTIVFDRRCKTDPGVDVIEIYRDEDCKSLLGSFYGQGPSQFYPITVPSDRCYLKFSTGCMESFWGYKFHAVPNRLVRTDEEIMKQPLFEFGICIFEWLLTLNPIWVKDVYSHEMFEALVAALNKSQARPEHEARRIRIISALTRFLSQWNTSITTPIPDVKQLRWLRQHLFDVYTLEHSTGKAHTFSLYLHRLFELVVLLVDLDEEERKNIMAKAEAFTPSYVHYAHSTSHDWFYSAYYTVVTIRSLVKGDGFPDWFLRQAFEASGRQEITFECPHPHPFNLRTSSQIAYPEEDVVGIDVFFDHRSETKFKSGVLIFSRNAIEPSQDTCGLFTEVFPKKKYRVRGNKFVWAFITDERVAEWGFRCVAEPVFTQEKRRELEKAIADKLKVSHESQSKFSITVDCELVEFITVNLEKTNTSIFNIQYEECNQAEKNVFPKLTELEDDEFRSRFDVLKHFNYRAIDLLPLIDLRAGNPSTIGGQLTTLRRLMSYQLKLVSFLKAMNRTRSFRPPPSCRLNRRNAMSKESTAHCLFAQAFRQLKDADPHLLRQMVRGWMVVFEGEASIDAGGPFRESITQFCTDILREDMNLFSLCPNAKTGVGFNQDKYVPRSSSMSHSRLRLLEFVGLVMGVVLRTQTPMELPMCPAVWKHLVGSTIDRGDLLAMDSTTCQFIDSLRNIDKEGVTEDTFSDIIFENFVAKTCDGMEVELVSGGRQMPVTWSNRLDYASRLERFKLDEFKTQAAAIRSGLAKIVSQEMLNIFTWRELELAVCGRKGIDVSLLKRKTVYAQLSETDNIVQWFWKVLESLSEEEKVQFLRFVWSRSTLPPASEWTMPFQLHPLVKIGGDADQLLPEAHTCFFTLCLPAYTSEDVLREKLIYAITTCKDIDADFVLRAEDDDGGDGQTARTDASTPSVANTEEEEMDGLFQ